MTKRQYSRVELLRLRGQKTELDPDITTILKELGIYASRGEKRLRRGSNDYNEDDFLQPTQAGYTFSRHDTSEELPMWSAVGEDTELTEEEKYRREEFERFRQEQENMRKKQHAHEDEQLASDKNDDDQSTDISDPIAMLPSLLRSQGRINSESDPKLVNEISSTEETKSQVFDWMKTTDTSQGRQSRFLHASSVSTHQNITTNTQTMSQSRFLQPSKEQMKSPTSAPVDVSHIEKDLIGTSTPSKHAQPHNNNPFFGQPQGPHRGQPQGPHHIPHPSQLQQMFLAQQGRHDPNAPRMPPQGPMPPIGPNGTIPPHIAHMMMMMQRSGMPIPPPPHVQSSGGPAPNRPNVTQNRPSPTFVPPQMLKKNPNLAQQEKQQKPQSTNPSPSQFPNQPLPPSFFFDMARGPPQHQPSQIPRDAKTLEEIENSFM